MNHRINFMAAVACVAVLTGCDWGGVDSDESWNDAYSWLNFGGTYTLADVGNVNVLKPVTPSPAPTPTPTPTPDKPSSKVETFKAQIAHVFNTTDKRGNFSGGVLNDGGKVGDGVVPRSVMVVVSDKFGERSFRDDGEGNLFCAASPSCRGTFRYGTGAWSLSGLRDMINPPIKVIVTYTYTMSTDNPDAGGGGDGGWDDNTGGAGTATEETGLQITFLHVTQKGNLLSMRDSAGNVYSGRFTGASVPSTGFMMPMDVRMSFEVKSANGISIVGSFSGNWSGAVSADMGMLNNRLLSATIATKKGHDDIRGTSSSIAIKTPALPPAAAE